MHLAKVSNGCLFLREQKQTLSVPPSFKKSMYFLLCTMHNETQEYDALEVANKNAQSQKGRIFRVKIWLYHNHILKETRQKGQLLSFLSYTKDLIGMETCKFSIQLIGESLTNKAFIIGWKTFEQALRFKIRGAF